MSTAKYLKNSKGLVALYFTDLVPHAYYDLLIVIITRY